MFKDAMKNELDNRYNYSITENGALGYATTNSKILDMNFKVTSYRFLTDEEIVNDFTVALEEDFDTAIKWAFYIRDIRGGVGERRLFRVLMACVIDHSPSAFIKLIDLIPEYGRWDDLIYLLSVSKNKDVNNAIYSLIRKTLIEDVKNMRDRKPVTLLAKWMPSESASSSKTKSLARRMMSALGMYGKVYRKTLSALRQYIDVVERKMSHNKWSEIDYNTVPSKANLIYRNAFLKRDEEKRRKYLGALIKQEKGVKINAETLFPCDIVSKYGGWLRRNSVSELDETIEALWKSQKDIALNEDVLVVADGSGSMCSCVGGGSSVTALDVANSLAIYFSERNNGEFKDGYITFSSRPQFVDFSGAKTLHDKLIIAKSYNEVSNTNIEATFNLLLDTAIKNGYSQKDIPSTLLVISDMEFDGCAEGVGRRIFDSISNKFRANGYSLPKLVFWNVCGRSNTIPMKQNENGVILMSGFSAATMNMALTNELNPLNALLAIIDSERYAPVSKRLADI